VTAPTPDGVVVVDKPGGWTSHDVVTRVRRIAGTRRVGHAGTLDPMATGVLVLGIERATRLLGHISATDKAYAATVRLGESTTTDDADGETLGGTDVSGLAREAIATAAAGFVGDLMQVPSAVSAIKVGGRRAYARVRAGETVELQPRSVRIDVLEVQEVRHTPPHLDVEISVTCSSGTYIRALARDLGRSLRVGGHLTRLRRTRVGTFTLAEATTVEELEQKWRAQSLAEVARRCFATQRVDASQAVMVRHGRALSRLRLPASGPVALLDEAGEFLALYEQHGPVARAVAVFVD